MKNAGKPKLNIYLSCLFAICLAVGLVFAVHLPVYANPGGGGSGTHADPFLISTAAQMATFRNNVNANISYQGQHIKLTNNIALSGAWTPIGTSSSSFQGTFDGAGYDISGLSLSGARTNTGLFGVIGTNGTVQNLTVRGAITTGGQNVGGIAGTNNGIISNCHSAVNINGTEIHDFVGGIVGVNANSVINCYYSGNIDVRGHFVGGIVGRASHTVMHCYVSGYVRGFGIVGGIIGDVMTPNITRNVLLGQFVEATANSSANRIAGGMNGSFTGIENRARNDAIKRINNGNWWYGDHNTWYDGIDVIAGSTANSSVFWQWNSNVWTIPSGNLTLTNLPTFRAFHTVTYNGNGNTSGAVIPALRYANLTTVTVAGATTSAGTLTRTGYSFNGWNTSAAGTGVNRNAGDTFNADASVTLFARWSPHTYTITLERQGGTGGSASVTATFDSKTLTGWTAPTRAGYTFQGYFTAATGGNRVISSVGSLESNVSGYTDAAGNWIRTSAPTLHAQWSQIVNLNRNGGEGGVTSLGMRSNSSTVTGWLSAPTRTGYTFDGYWTAATGGSRVLSTSGVLQANVTDYTNASSHWIWSGAAAPTLHAQWIPHDFTVTFDKNGGEGGSANTIATIGLPMPNIALPERAGYRFIGYYSEPVGGTRYYNADGSSTRNWDLASDTTLYARWSLRLITIIENETQNFSVEKSEINSLFENLTENPANGVTQAEIESGEDIILTLTVREKTQVEADGANEIIVEANGRMLQFFGITMEKDVGGVVTPLRELNVPVKVVIDLSPELSGRTGYSVYRYHGNEVQLIGMNSTDGEFFMISRGTGTGNVDQIIINTKRFSTYAVVEHIMALEINEPESFDVQARIIEDKNLVYRIDIAWGAMRFEYILSEDGESGEWDVRGFDGVNNEIKVTNRSNANVTVSFEITENVFEGDGDDETVVMIIVDEDDDEATDMELTRVVSSNDTAILDEVNVFLILEGDPSYDWIENNTFDIFTKVGIITVTIKPDE